MIIIGKARAGSLGGVFFFFFFSFFFCSSPFYRGGGAVGGLALLVSLVSELARSSILLVGA